MWLHVQFPFVDLRSFCAKERLAAPGFPAPVPGEEFLRGAGPVRQRHSGGLSGWIAEDKYCDARSAIRLHMEDLRQGEAAALDLQVAFRRFFFDGTAVGRFELGFWTNKWPTSAQLKDLLDAVMRMRIGVREVPVYSGFGRLLRRLSPRHGGARYTLWPLAQAGAALARFYARTSTKHGIGLDGREVVAGAPTLFLRFPAEQAEPLDLPPAAQPIALQQKGIALFHWWVSAKQGHAWACMNDAANEQDARKLRLYLMRLGAESEALSRVLKAIAEGRIAPKPHEAANEALQAYLNDATANVLSLSAKTRQFAQNPDLLADVAAASKLAFPPEWREALDHKLRDLKVRKNIIFKSNQHAAIAPPQGAFAAPVAPEVPQRPVVVFNLFSNIRAFNPVMNMNLSKQTSSVLAFIFGVVFVSALLAINIAIPNPTVTQHETFRIILALAAGGVGAMIPGILNVTASAGTKFAISAGGALAVFVIVFFFQPGLPPTNQIDTPRVTTAQK
jgi:hypothetical protein